MILPILGMLYIMVSGGLVLYVSFHDHHSYIDMMRSSNFDLVIKIAQTVTELGMCFLGLTAAITLYLIFSKRKLAGGSAIIHYVFMVGLAGFGFWADGVYWHAAGLTYFDNFERPAFLTLWAGLGLAYFSRSRRVKNTFTR